MSSARFFTCLIISNLKKRKEIKRVKVRMHLNLHKELCRLDGEVLNLDLDAVFRFFCKMLMCRETLGEGKQHFWERERSSHMKSFGFCCLTDSWDWCQVQENISLRKYRLIYLVVFNLTQSFILPCRRNLRHSLAECLIEMTKIYNNNTMGFPPQLRLVTNPFIDVIVPRFLDSLKVSSSFFHFSPHCKGSSHLFFCHYNF